VTFDEQLRASLDGFAAGLRTHLEHELRTCAEDLSRAAATERARVSEEAAAAARVAAEQQLSEMREATQRQNDEFRQAADTRIAELARTAEQSRAEAARLRQELDALGAQLADANRRANVAALETREQIAVAERQAREQAEQTFASQFAAAAANHKTSLDAALEQARTEQRESESAAAAHLLIAIRGLDATRGLGEVLDVLTHCGSREAERAAVLILKGERLQGWRFSGFANVPPRPTGQTLTLDDAGIAGAAVKTATPVSHASPDPAAATPALPPFANDAGGRHAVAYPVLLGGAAVAVLYADAPYSEEGTARWPAVLEVLTRYASRVLEAATLQQAIGLSREPVARASHAQSVPTGGA
jgi:hypothetical protein